ncbi:MAG: TatD family hydrolase [Dysgonamonadaceae bacterium]|jgi:TatD DNase family protein|nr:TatD family hydrolase [Dysgonamonadaceae bacterium]
MYLVDTHTHIYSEEFDGDRAEVIAGAQAAGVKMFFLPNIDASSFEAMHSLSDAYPDCCFPMAGLHPTSVNENFRAELEIVRRRLDSRKYIAIGEIGIDLYWDKTFRTEQIEAFETQLQWSIERNFPVSIHTREAFPEVFASIRNIGADRLRGVFHSFGGSRGELEEALEFENFLLGINGTVTYKNSRFREYLNIAPIKRILLETDAPYLPPVPHRGERNEPAYLPLVVAKLAEVYGISAEEIAEKTTENALRMFGVKPILNC